MITFTDEYVALVVAKDEPPAERLRVLLILAQQVATANGETSAVRDLFGLIRALVDQLAHQAAGGEQPAKGLR